MASAYYYNPAAGNAQNPNMPTMQNMNQIPMGMQPYGQPQYRGQVPPVQDPAAMRKRTPSKSKPSGPHPQNEEADEPSGDELDEISTRDIAMARYKRNHDYLSEIFTPYTSSSIIPPPFNLSKSEEELKNSIKETEDEMTRSKEQHTQKLNDIRQRIDGFWKHMNTVKDISDLEGILRSQKSMEESSNFKIEHNSELVHHVQIPGLEAEDPIPDHTTNLIQDVSSMPGGESQIGSETQLESEFEAQLMASSQHVEDSNKEAEFSWQTQGQSNAIDDNDFMFNEMMATTPTQEETPSVNEFLRTPEYDSVTKTPEMSGSDDMTTLNPSDNNM